MLTDQIKIGMGWMTVFSGGEYESVSPTGIMGPDGRKTVAIVVGYAWHPGEPDVSIRGTSVFAWMDRTG